MVSVHTIPQNDLRRHVTDAKGSCWCKPKPIKTLLGAAPAFSHNAADKRSTTTAHPPPGKGWAVVVAK